jgi:DNA-binding CsgD family transcriptional regulator
MRRGRPKHDDILTPREWDVLALIVEGLTNEQITQRLAISENTAKYHVAEILSKLEVPDLTAVRDWYDSGARRPARRAGWLGGLWEFLRDIRESGSPSPKSARGLGGEVRPRLPASGTLRVIAVGGSLSLSEAGITAIGYGCGVGNPEAHLAPGRAHNFLLPPP